MLLLEELNTKDLSKRIIRAKICLDNSIENLENTINQQNITKSINDTFPDELRTLVIDLWELVEKARQIKKEKETFSIAQKIIKLWEENIFRRLNKLKSKMLEWNRKHTNNQLPSIEEICGFPIREEIYYFDY